MNGFSWTEFYSEFASLVLDFENDREKLVEKIKQVFSFKRCDQTTFIETLK